MTEQEQQLEVLRMKRIPLKDLIITQIAKSHGREMNFFTTGDLHADYGEYADKIMKAVFHNGRINSEIEKLEASYTQQPSNKAIEPGEMKDE